MKSRHVTGYGFLDVMLAFCKILGLRIEVWNGSKGILAEYDNNLIGITVEIDEHLYDITCKQYRENHVPDKSRPE